MIWQGDFGKGVPTGSGVWSDPGVNPCLVYGPVPAAGISDNGVPFPSQRLGMVVTGDAGAEFIMGKLVLAAATDLLPGQAYELDEDYNMTLLTGGNSVLNAEVVLAQVWYPQCPAGTYYVWGQRAGRAAAIMAAASVATGYAETTATAGVLKYPATPTAGQKSVAPASAKGLDYAEDMQTYEREVEQAIARDGGSSMLSLSPQPVDLNRVNLPDGSFGV